ncbi:MAG: hypothetical protein M0R48_11495 [Candidatus Omnitrophica bacterium]|nr:hypothetical protein [Candidatus Omnitrophota bacterium]
MRKEVQINGKWYWELEATDKNQAFNPPESCYVWDEDILNAVGHKILLIRSQADYEKYFVSVTLVGHKHCALLSSEHEKKSRRVTIKEISKWILGGNGFWLDQEKYARTSCDFEYEKLNSECGKSVVSICTWDGEPMEPTAQNMGLEE